MATALGKGLRRGCRQAFRCSSKAVKPRARSLSLFGIDRSEQFLHGTGGRRAERLVEADGFRQLLANEVVTLREFTTQCRDDPASPPRATAAMPRSHGVPALY